MQVTRFAAPLAYNYLHVIRMNEYLGSDRVRRLPLLHWFGKAWETVQAGHMLPVSFLQARSLFSAGQSKSSASHLLAVRVPCVYFQCELLLYMQATVFAQEMGTAMHDVPVFGTDFNTWFPLVVVVYCTLL